MSGNLCQYGGGGVGGVRRLMAKTILNFHFDYLTPSLTHQCNEVQTSPQMLATFKG